MDCSKKCGVNGGVCWPSQMQNDPPLSVTEKERKKRLRVMVGPSGAYSSHSDRADEQTKVFVTEMEWSSFHT